MKEIYCPVSCHIFLPNMVINVASFGKEFVVKIIGTYCH